MMLNDFENMLRSIANDKMLMSYGNNYNVVNSLISVVGLVQSLSNLVQNDRTNDMFAMSINNKVRELESVIAMFGGHRLMSCGINTGTIGGGMQPMGPFMPNNAMYNQQMYYPNMMGGMMPMQGFNPMMQQQMPPQQSMQQMPQQPMFNPAAPMPAEPKNPASQPKIAVPAEATNASTPVSNSPVVNDISAPSKAVAPVLPNKAAAPAFSLPGVGGGGEEKAAGRDYLLSLLEDK